ncbi:hypothetical protein GOARA_019_00350 [Gordonia araii NBRC 100433]|uniref:Acyl-CoA carboxylase epsilon subunit n=1 Tax=Gordonia araii NBRC 100433 TaxID=1073574 RepID=G7GYS8_9ACTN|nr:acyl-CoA carboxylase epsilon subunit [Gordonia araii]NNG98946.1 acyl-CoA carboxylase subunit epsilon [Gordonia araii NBRC 100433]GAB08753.1 hypothetical protein GOARA_019_00350 [Gordonia araii NBRC 100433]
MSNAENADTGSDRTDKPKPPFVKVVKGNPDPTQVAAITAVIAARASAAPSTRREPRNDWGRPVDRLRPRWASATSFYRHVGW